jgi:phosphoserine phosphatase
MSDPINPSHYTRYAVDVIEITQDLDFLSGNVVKYVCRAPYKNDELEDLLKAQWYLNHLIKKVQKKYENLQD